MWAGSLHPIKLKTWVEQKGWVRGNLSCLPVWVGTLVFSGLWTQAEIPAFWFSSLSAFRFELMPLVLLRLQPANSGSWDFSASTVLWVNALCMYMYIHIHTHNLVYSLLDLFLWRACINTDLPYASTYTRAWNRTIASMKIEHRLFA